MHDSSSHDGSNYDPTEEVFIPASSNPEGRKIKPGSMWGCERPFPFSSPNNLVGRIDVQARTREHAEQTKIAYNALRPIVRSIRFTAHTGTEAAGVYVPTPLKIWWLDAATIFDDGAGGPLLTPTEGVAIYDTVRLSNLWDEGECRRGYGVPENSAGWMRVAFFVQSTAVVGVSGSLSFRLGWELKP